MMMIDEVVLSCRLSCVGVFVVHGQAPGAVGIKASDVEASPRPDTGVGGASPADGAQPKRRTDR